jgi:ATP-dependent DNA ligase
MGEAEIEGIVAEKYDGQYVVSRRGKLGKRQDSQ